MNFDIIYDKIKEEVMDLFTDAKGSHDWEHTERVIKLALRLSKKEKADTNVIRFASLLHDIGRKSPEKNISHADTGAVIAEEILLKYINDKEFIKNVINCIRKHSFRKGETLNTIEEKIVYDADKLDAIGAIGIGRAFVFSGECGAKVHNNDINVLETQAYSREDTAYREYMVKLRYIKDKLYTDGAREIAEERHAFMEAFFDRLCKESEGEL